jgi:hypothetical protein
MKIYSLLLLALLLVSSCDFSTDTDKKKMPLDNDIKMATKQLRHVVLFKFKETSSPSDIQDLEAGFAALPAAIPEIKDFEWGLNNSPENLNKGFTHCFFVTFGSEEGRDIYLPHPAHKAFVDRLLPHIDDSLVLDYWVK